MSADVWAPPPGPACCPDHDHAGYCDLDCPGCLAVLAAELIVRRLPAMTTGETR